MTLAHRSIVITAASRVAPVAGDAAASNSLAGLALFLAERTDGEWSFDIRARMLAAGQREETLLDWAADRLPDASTVVGWQLGDRLVPLLLDATRRATPTVAHRFTERLARLVTAPVFDLAHAYGRATAPAFTEITVLAGINEPPAGDTPHGTVRSIDALRRQRIDLAAEAVALWRVWALHDEEDGASADAAAAVWLADRREQSERRAGSAA